MSDRLIAIGDIHGCIRALNKMLETIAPQPDDCLVLLGDYIDRGAESRAVVERILELEKQCHLIPLLGNHELMLLWVLREQLDIRIWTDCGGNATLNSYGGALDQIPDAHRQFFEGCRRFHESDTHLFLHANYAADLPLDQQPDQLLFWEHLSFTIPPPHQSGKTAIVGHTPQLSGEIFELPHLSCIDTFCVGGQWLTALDVRHGTVWQVDKYGHVRGNGQV